MEIETALAKLNTRLESLRGGDKLMKIGNNQFEMSDKDPIYFLTGPNKKQTKTTACVSCRDFQFKNEKQMHYCQFCGKSNCENCMYKERMFPRGRIDADGKKPLGKICKVCDRKFLMRIMTLENAVAMQKTKQQVKTLDNLLDEAKRENLTQIEERDQDRYRYGVQLDELDKQIEDMQVQSNLLQNQLIVKGNEKEELLTKYKDVKQEQHMREREEGGMHTSDEEDPELGKSLFSVMLISEPFICMQLWTHSREHSKTSK